MASLRKTTGRVIGRRVNYLYLLARAVKADRAARKAGGPGLVFAAYGRQAALRTLARRERAGLDMLLTPVSIVRYWEFPFVLRHLPPVLGACLDVASPRLFSCYVAERRHAGSIRILNPDPRDARETSALARALRIASISVDEVPVAAINGRADLYDAIWSISVIEHIADHGDREAMAILWGALRPGGRLVVTVPVDRVAWDEYREADTYELGLARGPNGYFFQRWYDEGSLHSRLLAQIAGAQTRIEWFGERRAGRFAEYERAWMTRGHALTVDDPREIAMHYSSFPSFGAMPGRGVAGIVLEKPVT